MTEGGPPRVNNELFKGNNWVLPTDIDLVLPAEEAFARKLKKAGWGQEAEYLRIAFNEVLVNAIAHGNLGVVEPEGSEERIRELAKREQKVHPTDKKVHVTIKIDDKRVSIIVRDEGKGFNPKAAPDPTKPENLLKTTGRGLFIMKTYFTSVTHNKKGNEVTMIKERKK